MGRSTDAQQRNRSQYHRARQRENAATAPTPPGKPARINPSLLDHARHPAGKLDRAQNQVAPVKRRIDRLEADGVIAGYTAIVREPAEAAGIEAFMQLRIAPGADVASTLDPLRQMPEVQEVLMTAGEQDALVRLRVDGMDHLRAVVIQLRRTSTVVETRTHIVLDRWDRRTDQACG